MAALSRKMQDNYKASIIIASISAPSIQICEFPGVFMQKLKSAGFGLVNEVSASKVLVKE
ncbi:hypothetical protein D3C76_1750370 [compost metagenome]